MRTCYTLRRMYRTELPAFLHTFSMNTLVYINANSVSKYETKCVYRWSRLSTRASFWRQSRAASKSRRRQNMWRQLHFSSSSFALFLTSSLILLAVSTFFFTLFLVSPLLYAHPYLFLYLRSSVCKDFSPSLRAHTRTQVTMEVPPNVLISFVNVNGTCRQLHFSRPSSVSGDSTLPRTYRNHLYSRFEPCSFHPMLIRNKQIKEMN